MNWLEQEIKEIELDEGVRLTAYLDTVGVWTIGFGHTAGVKKGDTCSMEQAHRWLQDDIHSAIADAEALCPTWDSLSPPRKGVMVNMAFNMGRPGLGSFKNTLRYIAEGEYKKAAVNMLRSKWASQVGRRATRLAHRMEHNTYAAR